VLEQPVVELVKVKVTVPPFFPVTTPLFVTVTMDSSALDHVPPLLGVTLAVVFVHKVVAPPKTGLAITVIVLVAVQPAD
jgi:hypothetical protein